MSDPEHTKPLTKGISRLFSTGGAADPGVPHLVICGFGRLGRAVVDASAAAGSASHIWVVERDHDRAEVARRRGLNVVCGNAADSHTQRIARVGSAADIAICIDPPETEAIVRVARSLSPTAHIQVGISEPSCLREITSAGANRILVLSTIAGKLLADPVLPL